jgi:hypothetical protein
MRLVTYLLGGLTVSGVLVVLARAWSRRQPDEAWKATGTKPLISDPYDQEQASMSVARAKTRSASGRVYGVPKRPTSRVVPMRRRVQ